MENVVSRKKKTRLEGMKIKSFKIQLFRERLSERVQTTIPKGIVGGFVFTVFQRNLKEWHEKPWIRSPERATSILGLCHGVFTDQFIFRHILGHFFPRKQNLHHVYERIRSMRYQKGKLNVIKRQKISFLGLQVLLTGL